MLQKLETISKSYIIVDDSCQSGTRFLKLADNVPQIYGQRSCIMRTRTLSQRDKLTSLVVNVS